MLLVSIDAFCWRSFVSDIDTVAQYLFYPMSTQCAFTEHQIAAFVSSYMECVSSVNTVFSLNLVLFYL